MVQYARVLAQTSSICSISNLRVLRSTCCWYLQCALLLQHINVVSLFHLTGHRWYFEVCEDDFSLHCGIFVFRQLDFMDCSDSKLLSGVEGWEASCVRASVWDPARPAFTPVLCHIFLFSVEDKRLPPVLPFFSDERELPSVKYLCKAYYSGPLLSAFNSYHSQHDNSCKINFIKSVTRNFSFFSFCVDFCDSWKGHEKVEQCLDANYVSFSQLQFEELQMWW